MSVYGKMFEKLTRQAMYV